MRLLSLLLGLNLMAGFAWAESNTRIVFQKKNAARVLEYKLPLKCELEEVNCKARFGELNRLEDDGVRFSYYDFDTAAVNRIWEMDVSRKTKDLYLDTLINQSQCYEIVPIEQISKISILSGDGKKGRQMVMLLASVGVIGSGFSLLSSVSNNVDGGFKRQDWLKCVGIALGSSIMAVMIKKRLDMRKWEIIRR